MKEGEYPVQHFSKLEECKALLASELEKLNSSYVFCSYLGSRTLLRPTDVSKERLWDFEMYSSD